MKKLLVIGLVGLSFVGLSQSFLQVNKTPWTEVVKSAITTLKVNPTLTLSREHVEILYKIGILSRDQAVNLYAALEKGPITSVSDLLSVKKIGDSTVAILCLLFRLDTTGWKAYNDK